MTSLPFRLLLVLLTTVLAAGCASSASTSSSSDPADVVGTWEYRSYDSRMLGEGKLKIYLEQGRLEGKLRDSRLGNVPVRVRYRGASLDLELRETLSSARVTVSGHVEDETFTGSLRLPMYDVSTSQSMSSYDRRRLTGSLVARRIEAPNDALPGVDLGCTLPSDMQARNCR